MSNVKIHIRKGATLMELTQGRTVPEVMVLGDNIVTTAIEWPDDEGEHIYEISYHGKRWTVDYTDVTVLGGVS